MRELLMQARAVAKPMDGTDTFLFAVLGVCVGIVLAGPMVDWVKTRVLAGFGTTQKPTEEQVAVMVILVWLFLPLVLLVALATGVGKGLAYLGRGVRDWARVARTHARGKTVMPEIRADGDATFVRCTFIETTTPPIGLAIPVEPVDPFLAAARREVDAIAPNDE